VARTELGRMRILKVAVTFQTASPQKKMNNMTRMWADAQRDGRPAEHRWRTLRKFRNSIPCTVYHAKKFG